jgi:predicted O-methyltransferase YrrM
MMTWKDPAFAALLAELHERSDQQIAEMHQYYANCQAEPPFSAQEQFLRTKRFMSDKLVALDRDKAEFCYQLILASHARRIIEIGTSYGVSTLYLAAALRDNIRTSGGDGVVIGTEYEPDKLKAAQAHVDQADLTRFVELRQGDLRETLKDLDEPVDVVLIDIWIEMARPALELLSPLLKAGAVILCDNTQQYRSAYSDYFAFLNDPVNAFHTMTLPFTGGFEMSVRHTR